MHRAYQPTAPAANKYLQKKWDQSSCGGYDCYDLLVFILISPFVCEPAGKGEPGHHRDNHILSSKLSDIMRSKGLVDHRNSYPERSLNAEKRRQQLQEVTRENQGFLERITIQQSEYQRQRWEEDWGRTERCRDDIARYPRSHQPAGMHLDSTDSLSENHCSTQQLQLNSRTH
ncbi:UNVERIFIED_CONTAM: hypothetical protein FKN15_040665 [Acipenser sinensis]